MTSTTERFLRDMTPQLKWLYSLVDGMAEWSPDAAEAVTEARRPPVPEPEPEAPLWVAPVVDLTDEAARVRYPDKRNAAGKVTSRGRIKRTRYAPRELADVRVVGVHQMGVERDDDSTRWIYVSAQRVIRPDGTRLIVHPHTCRTITANALDRAPFHATNIEVAGNFEGVDGEGGWYKPDVFGAGRASTRQLLAIGYELRDTRDAIAGAGGRLELVAPHRVSGRSSSGKPNRPICPGSRVWQASETLALALGLEVPANDWTLGGMPIPLRWRSRAWLEAFEDVGKAEAAGWRDDLDEGERELLERVAA